MSTHPRSALALALLTGSLALACVGPLGPKTPPVAVHEATAEPAPAVEPEAPSLSLSELPGHYEFAFVRIGRRGRDDFYERFFDEGGPALLSEVWMEDTWPEALQPVIDEAFGSQEQRWRSESLSRLVPLDPAALAAVGFEAPRTPVWLIGPAGPCRARIGAPMLGWYAPGPEAVELSWQLSLDDSRPGCELSVPEQWSQIAVLAETLPPELRFVPAELVNAGRVNLPTWVSPYAALVRAAVASSEFAHEHRVDEVWVRERAVANGRLISLTVAMVHRHHPDLGEAPNPCDDWQQNRVIVGYWYEGSFVPLLTSLEPWRRDNVELRGAFMLGEELVWTVHESWFEPIIGVPGREDDADWLNIAVFHEEDFGEVPYSQVEYCGP